MDFDYEISTHGVDILPHRLISIEGIIGAGKSTLTENLAKKVGYRYLAEPIQNNKYLPLFYKDPKRWALPMQFHLLNERFSIQKLAAWEAYSETPYRGAILDRSLPGDRVFCRLHYELGNISKLEWETYERSFEIFTNSLIPPSLMIFLDVDPNIALQRIQRRDRLAEKEISKNFGKKGRDDTMYEYLILLQQGYYDLIAEIQQGRHAWSRGMKVLKIDWNDDFKSVDQLISVIKATS